MRQLAPADAMFYSMETPENPVTICMMLICDPSTSPKGALSFDSIHAHIEAEVKENWIFQQRLIRAPMDVDFPYWVRDEDVDLTHHIKHLGLPKPGNWKQYCSLVAEVNLRPMDHDRPPWELYIIDGLDDIEGVPKGSFAVFGRFHHAYVCGKSMLDMLLSLMSDSPKPRKNAKKYRPAEPDDLQEVGNIPNQFELWSKTLPKLWKDGLNVYKAGIASAKSIAEVITGLAGDLRPEQISMPRTKFTANLSNKRVWDSISWDLQELKGIRVLHEGASLNDVLVSIIAGGLRRYLASHDDLPDDNSLVAMCPISLRKPGDDFGGNELISTMLVGMGTNIEDPIERLISVQRRTTKGISVSRALNDMVLNMDKLRPAYVRNMQAGVKKEKPPEPSAGPNTMITNIPGPMGGPKYFAGAEVLSLQPMVPAMDGITLIHAISGIGKNISLGVLSDAKIMTDMNHYLDCLRESTEEYLQAVAQKAT